LFPLSSIDQQLTGQVLNKFGHRGVRVFLSGALKTYRRSVADIWGFAESTEKSIRVHGRKPQISPTAKVKSKSTLRERLRETPEPHSRNPIISPGLFEKLPNRRKSPAADGAQRNLQSE